MERKKRLLKGICAVIAASLVFAVNVFAADVNLPPPVEKALESRVLITLSAENIPEEVKGSGFVVDSARVVTCAHIFSDLLYYTTKEKIIIKVSKDSHSPATAAKIILMENQSDLAVLEVEELSKIGPPVKFAERFPKDGATVYASGFWFNGSFKATLKATLLGMVEKPVPYNNYLVQGAAVLDRSILLGFSGGPVFDENGRVVGMNLATAPGASLILSLEPIIGAVRSAPQK